MNLKTRLQEISRVLIENRMTGHTTVLAQAAKNIGATVLAHNVEHARQIEHQHGVPARSMDVNLRGMFGPFVMDHFATSTLLNRAANKIEALEKEILELQEELERRNARVSALEIKVSKVRDVLDER